MRPEHARRMDKEVERYDRDFIAQHDVMTDLAVEAHEVVQAAQPQSPQLPGVNVEHVQEEHARISRVSVVSEIGARLLGKMKGTYITIESEALRSRAEPAQEAVGQYVAKEITALLERLGVAEDGCVLVVGLGNWNATPDAVGPRVVGRLLVTRHLYELSPPELRGGLRPVAAVSPGVLGLTGIETGEIVRALVSAIGPACVICIDALAARSVHRVGTTIQLADTGIHPGSGVGNTRRSITSEELGVPVIAMGVPTVVGALTIASDAIDAIGRVQSGAAPQAPPADELPQSITERLARPAFRLGPEPTPNGGQANGVQPSGAQPQAIPSVGAPAADPAQRRRQLQDALGAEVGRMIVTPKEVDVLVDDIADVLAGGINAALHPSIDLSQIIEYLQ